MKNITVICILLTLAISCTNPMSKYEDIKLDKTRPVGIVCEPSEAAPGDTVQVNYYGYFPSDNYTIHWTLSLDYYPNGWSRHEISVDNLMLPGSTPTSFRFVVPDSTLLYSQYLVSKNKSIQGTLGLTIGQADSILKVDAKKIIAPPAKLLNVVDQICCQVQLNAHIQSEIEGDVYRGLMIRYSRHFGSQNVNMNPQVNWIQIITVDKQKLTDPDSIMFYPHTTQYLYRDGVAIYDTIVVENTKSYFVAADSGIDGSDTLLQKYSYVSSIDGSLITEREWQDYQWFYTNLDKTSDMVEDSLILFSGKKNNIMGRIGRSADAGNIKGFLPPVVNSMHHFKLWLAVRDNRNGFFAKGVTEREVEGYFDYK